MKNEKPVFIRRGSPEDIPLPFPHFATYAEPRTNQQVKNTQRHWEADAIFGFYKLKLSTIDDRKMLSYLDGEISADQLIDRFIKMI